MLCFSSIKQIENLYCDSREKREEEIIQFDKISGYTVNVIHIVRWFGIWWKNQIVSKILSFHSEGMNGVECDFPIKYATDSSNFICLLAKTHSIH